MSERSLYQCLQCGEHKRPDGFHGDKAKKSGLTARCKECRRENQRRWAEENRERIRAYRRTHYAKNVEKERERRRKKYQKYRERERQYELRFGRRSLRKAACEWCGWDEATCDIHRIIPGGPYTAENVITLCPNCHRVETERLQMQAE